MLWASPRPGPRQIRDQKPRDCQEFRNPNPQNQELQEHLWAMMRLAGVLFSFLGAAR